MSRFFAELLSLPEAGLSTLCRYIVWNGYLYLAAGLALLVLPEGAHELLFRADLHGFERGFVRVVGLTVAIIGWFYVMGGRTGSTSFALATVVDRLLVPFVLVPLAVAEAVPALAVLPFAILDPVLAVGALVLWRRAG